MRLSSSVSNKIGANFRRILPICAKQLPEFRNFVIKVLIYAEWL